MHSSMSVPGRDTRRAALFAGLIGISAAAGSADILSVSGSMEIASAPISFLEGATESSTAIRILDEGTSVLVGDIAVNAVGPGTHTYSAGPPLTISSGSLVHSYIVHFDPDGGVVPLLGSVTFDVGEFIIGIMTHTPYLDFSDAEVGHPLAVYPTGLLEFRAFETLPGTDSVTIAADLNSASFSLIAELGIDQARIITTPVPEPTAWLGVLLAGGFLTRRRPR